MLVITRNTQNNSIKIGDDIEVKIVRVTGGQVRLAIDAPKEVAVVRSELLKRG